MSWLKPSVYIIGLLIVIFGGALLLDQAAGMLGLTKYLPNRLSTQHQIEQQYHDMWQSLQQIPPESAGYNKSKK